MKLGKKILILFLSLLLCFSGIGGGVSLIIQGSNLRAETVEAKDKGVSALAGPLYNDYWTSNQIYYNTDWEGDGTATSPYKISSNADLAGLAYEVNNGNDHRDHYFKQTADINLGAHYWNPIGGHSASGVILREDCYFAGNYDGDGYKIDYMYVRGGGSSTYSYQGLFGYVKKVNNTCSITNVVIGENSNVAGYDFVGGIVGQLVAGPIKNCSNSANVESVFTGLAESSVGGIIGRCVGESNTSYCIVDGCYNYGLIERNGQTEIGNVGTGGVIGNAESYTNITNCYNAGTIRAAKGDCVGGVVGFVPYINRVGIDGCYNVGAISGGGNAGGIVGNADVRSTDTASAYKCGFANCYNTGTITGSGENVGGIIGYLSLSSTAITEITISGCYNIAAVTGDNHVGGLCGFAVGKTTINNSYNSGVVTATNGSDGVAGGILGSSLNNILVISQSTNEGEVKGGQNVGGIIGYSDVKDTNQHKTTITSSRNLGAINAMSIYVGGIIGNSYGDSANSSEIKNCYNAGNVTTTKSITAASSDGTGGIVGRSVNTTVSNCYNRASVTAASGYIVGGIVGWGANNSKIYNCFNTGAVSSRTQSGGIIGFNGTASYMLYSYYGGACTLNNAYGSSTNTTAAYLAYYNNKSGSIYTSGTSNPVSNNIYANLVTYIQQAAFFTGTYNSFTYWNSGYGWSFSGSTSIWQTTTDHPVLRTVASAPTAENLEKTSIVTYSANGGTGYMAPQFTGLGDVIIKDCDFDYAFDFISWNTDPSGSGEEYMPGTVYTEKESLTLFAIWSGNEKDREYTITFELNGGTTTSGGGSLDTIKYYFSTRIDLPRIKKDPPAGEDDPTKKYALLGWQPTSNSGNWDTRVIYKVDDSLTYMYGDVTLRAVWGSDFWTAHYKDVENFDFKVGATGEASNPYIIDSVYKLAYLAYLVNSGDGSLIGKYFRQSAVLDLYAHVWDPIGSYVNPFRGVYDGGGLEIRGLITPKEQNFENSYRGLFGEVDEISVVQGSSEGVGSVISNVYITDNSKITGYASVGAVVGYLSGNNTVLKNCINYGEVQGGSSAVGGIVGSISNGAKVINCRNYGKVAGANELGGICGNANNSASIENCENYGSVTGSDSNIGGICGRIYSNATNYGILKSHNDAQISGVRNVGGIVGYAYDAGIINICYNEGSVSASQYGAGGVVGEAIASASGKFTIKNCYNAGRVACLFTGNDASSNGHAGGFCASTSGDLSIENSYNRGDVSLANGSGLVGGFIGKCVGSTIKSCYSVGDVIHKDGAPANGFIGANNATVNGCSWGGNCSLTTTCSGATYTANLIIDAKRTSFYNGNGWDLTSVWQLVDYKNDGYLSFKDETQLNIGNGPRNSSLWTGVTAVKNMNINSLQGNGMASNPYQVSTAEQLAYISYIVNNGDPSFTPKTFENNYFKQTADIDLSAYYWNPIGQNNTNAFKGIYDGDGHTISGMFINNNGNVGLFGYVSGATAVVRNVIISADSYVNGYGDVGGIAAKIDDNATVENCVNNAYIVSNNACMGGIVGTLQTSKIKNCTNNGSIFMLGDSGTTNAVGGICGRTTKNNIEISGSYNNGKVFSKLAESTGGIVGKVEDGSNINITNCQNRGEVCEAGTKVGGIVGKAESVPGLTISKSNNSGKVSGTKQVGGIVGVLSGGSNLLVTDCYNTGHVLGSIDVGGIVGWQGSNTTVTKCYNAGFIYGLGMVGGVIGEIMGGSTSNTFLSNSYNAGNVGVSGTNTDGGTRVAGGVVGCSANAKVSYCYNIGNVSLDKVTTAPQLMGGIAGSDATSQQGDNIIINCVNSGRVSSNESDGKAVSAGIISNRTKKVNNCYWNTTFNANATFRGTALGSDSAGYAGSSLFTDEAFYRSTRYWCDNEAWDVDQIWGVNRDINSGYPFLRSTDVDLTSLSRATITIKNKETGLTSTSATYDGSTYIVNVTLPGVNRDDFKVGSAYTMTIFKNGLEASGSTTMVDAGDYSISIDGIGSYSGHCEATFTISPYDFTADAKNSSASVRVSSPKDGSTYQNFPYTGLAPQPQFDIKDKLVNNVTYTLRENVDYVVTYPENGDYGTHNVVIKGIGNYAGTINVKINVTLKAQFDAEYGYWYVEVGYMPQTRVTADLNKLLGELLDTNSLSNSGNTYYVGENLSFEAYRYNNTEYVVNNGQWYVVEPIRWALSNVDNAQSQAVLAQIVSVGTRSNYGSLASSFMGNIPETMKNFLNGGTVGTSGAETALKDANHKSLQMRFSDLVCDLIQVKKYIINGSTGNVVYTETGDPVTNATADGELCGVQFTVTLTSFAR